jgi:hypothetical protein
MTRRLISLAVLVALGSTAPAAQPQKVPARAVKTRVTVLQPDGTAREAVEAIDPGMVSRSGARNGSCLGHFGRSVRSAQRQVTNCPRVVGLPRAGELGFGA